MSTVGNLKSLDKLPRKNYMIILHNDNTNYRIITGERFSVYKFDSDNKAIHTSARDALLHIKAQKDSDITVACNNAVLDDISKREVISMLWITYTLKSIAPRKKSISVSKLMEENEKFKIKIKEQAVELNNVKAIANDVIENAGKVEKQTNKLSAAELLGLKPVRRIDDTFNATTLPKDEPQWIKDAREMEKKMSEEILNKKGQVSEI
jgi:hypothetical protein